MTNNNINNVNEIINNIFEKEYKNPLVDVFYFISLEMIKCKKCNKVFDINYKYDKNKRVKNNFEINFSLLLNKTNKKENIFNLIKRNIFSSKIENNIKCNNCNLKTYVYNFLYNSPLYLIFEFEDGNNIILDKEIDLTPYILTDVGPRKYEFYAGINEDQLENNNYYITIIKKESSFILFSNYEREEYGEEGMNIGKPCIAIYKGQVIKK